MLGERERRDVREVINKESWPLGPSYTEPLIDRGADVFRQLYDETNPSIVRRARTTRRTSWGGRARARPPS